MNKEYILKRLKEMLVKTDDLIKEMNEFNEELIEQHNPDGSVKIKEVKDENYKFYDDMFGEYYLVNIAGIAYMHLASTRNHIAWAKSILEALIDSLENNKRIQECLKERGWKIT